MEKEAEECLYKFVGLVLFAAFIFLMVQKYLETDLEGVNLIVMLFLFAAGFAMHSWWRSGH